MKINQIEISLVNGHKEIRPFNPDDFEGKFINIKLQYVKSYGAIPVLIIPDIGYGQRFLKEYLSAIFRGFQSSYKERARDYINDFMLKEFSKDFILDLIKGDILIKENENHLCVGGRSRVYIYKQTTLGEENANPDVSAKYSIAGHILNRYAFEKILNEKEKKWKNYFY